MERSHLEQLLARGDSLAQIGRRFGVHESTVASWLASYGLRAAGRERHAARGGLERDQLEALVLDGLSIGEIAERVGRSKATVRHWLVRHGLKTGGTRRQSVQHRARAAGITSLTLHCPRHGESDFSLNGRGYYRCRQCRSDAVVRRRRKVKEILVREAGGSCCLCGYSRSMRALHFHHLDPAQKRHELNAKGVAMALDKLRVEARKCVLLCSNCHAEVEDGLALVPSELARKRLPG